MGSEQVAQVLRQCGNRVKLVITRGHVDENPSVSASTPESRPADKVDGVDIQGYTNQQAVEVLRHTGQAVHLKLIRRGFRPDEIPPAVAPVVTILSPSAAVLKELDFQVQQFHVVSVEYYV